MFVLFLLLLIGLGFGINIGEAMKIASEESPYLKVWKERIKRFKGMKLSAKAFPNPNIRFESGFLTTTDSPGSLGRFLYLLEFSQEFPLWKIRAIKERYVDELEKAFTNLYEVEKRKLLGKVYVSFYEALYFKERYELMKKNYKLSRELEDFIQKAYKVGQASSLDMLRAKRERRLIEAKLKVEEAFYLSKLRELSSFLGKPVNRVEGDFKILPNLPPISLDEHPSIKFLKFKIRATDEEIKMLKALAKPKVEGGVVLEDSEEGYYGLRIALNVKVPIYYRNKGEILEKSSEKSALTQELRVKKLELQATLKATEGKIRALKEAIKELKEKAIPDAKKELALALKGYQDGAISFFELNNVKRRYYELLFEELNLLLELHRAYSKLITVGGWK